VPRDPLANLAFRKTLRDAAAKDKSVQRELIEACRQDLLFYVNAFVWQYNPRKVAGKMVMPFCSYKFQDDALANLQEGLENEADSIRLLKKSREMGATWLVLILFDWRARFHPYQSFLIGSRDEELVDKTGDSRSLFWKLDFLHDHLPPWLQTAGGERYRIDKHIDFSETKSIIDGTTTNKHLARGDRRTAILLDEKAAMENGFAINEAVNDACHLRIDASTPEGPSTAFRDDENRLMKAGLDEHVIRLHWSLHPDKGRGLYTVGNHGEITLLDKAYWTPERERAYKFIQVQPKSKYFKYRSPWYDEDTKRRSDRDIAKNLDMDDEGSLSIFFDAAEIAKLKLFCRPADETGRFEYEPDSASPIGWQPFAESPVMSRLWIKVGKLGRPPNDRSYGAGADLSWGNGYSNSTLTIVDFKTREKVAEFACSRMKPEAWASFCVAVCRWFAGPNGEGAKIVWEAHGPGIPFGDTVVTTLHYSRIWDFKVDSPLKRFDKNRKPGYGMAGENKGKLLSKYRDALESGEFRNFSEEALDETLHYVFSDDGSRIEHEGSRRDSAQDPSGAKNNHGDRVIADALANLLLSYVPKSLDPLHEPAEQYKPEIPVLSIAWCREQRRLKEMEVSRY
jgi:hypothetical protein